MSTATIHPDVLAYMEKSTGLAAEGLAQLSSVIDRAQALKAGQSDAILLRRAFGYVFALETALMSRNLRMASLRLDMMSEDDFTPIPYPAIQDGKTVVKFTERTASLRAPTENADVVILEYCQGTLERLPTVVEFEKEFLAKGGRILHLIDVGV